MTSGTLLTTTDSGPSSAVEELSRTLRAPAGRARRLVRRQHNALLRALHEDRTGEHLVEQPVFILCPTRSGSTLLRSMLNSHTQICAPHELHLATMQVSTEREYAVDSWSALGLSLVDMENMLWDRGLHRVLVRSGKRIVVDKTPQNVAVWQRIHAFWPNARYIHLRRHPVSVLQSRGVATPADTDAKNTRTVLSYGRWLNAARAALPGPTVRYEDLVAEPETTLRVLCDYVGVRYQPRMLSYKPSHTRAGRGDWSAKIKAGSVQPPRPLPTSDEVPSALRELVRNWGY